MEAIQINNNTNGNPRYVIHFLDILCKEEKEISGYNRLDEMYKIALKKAKKIGGKKYHNKSYGGGISFSTWNLNDTLKKLQEIKKINTLKK